MPEQVSTANGINATTFELMPVSFSVAHNKMVPMKVHQTTYVFQSVLRSLALMSSTTSFDLNGNRTCRMNHANRIIIITNGIIRRAHSENETSKPASARNLTAVAFGGVPIGVPMPPRLAATGIASERPILPLSSLGRTASTGARNASIIAAVAVLLINIEKMAITTRKPSSTHFGFVPKGFSIMRARVTSRPYFDAIIASTNPPRKSITTGSANADIILV